MRFLRFELKNYAGIVNGMGLETLTIDFSRCKNTITLITGKNGVGKSTLLKAMNPLPDGTECYLENHAAHKAMTIQDENNIYEIMIISDLNGNMVRQQNRAYIKKNGIDLNPTGNIGSYKDIIFNEFELDANFMTLSRLSSEDRGLAMKTPSERKKFIASILSTIEVYNDINKALTKKVNIFKSYINNLDSKINNIGDPIQLRASVDEIEVRYGQNIAKRDTLIAKQGEASGFISSVDPDGKIQEQYQAIYDQIKEINGELENLQVGDIKDPEAEEARYQKLVTKLNAELATAIANMNSEQSIIEDFRSRKDIDSQRLENQKNGFEIDNLEFSVETLRKQVKSLEEKFEASQIAYETISRDKFVLLIDILSNFRDNISAVYTHYDNDVIVGACQAIGSGSSISAMVDDITRENNNLAEELINCRSEHEIIVSKLDSISALDKRPKNCKLDSCPFVSDMVTAQKQKKTLDANEKQLASRISSIEAKMKANNDTLEKLRDQEQASRSIVQIMSAVSSNTKLIEQFPTVAFFNDKTKLLKRIETSNTFPEIEDLFKLVDLFNEVETLKTNKNKLISLEADYKVAKAVKESIDLLEESIQRYNKEIEDHTAKYESALATMQTLSESLEYNKGKLEEAQLAKGRAAKVKELTMKKDALKSQYEKIRSDISRIKEYVDQLNFIAGEIQSVNNEITAIEKERDDLNFALTNLNAYTKDLEMYKNKYNIINTLKRYSSPSTGIQTLYMDMYMGKTLTMANELLSMMFGGEYKLLPYVINENEFRIPFVGNGLPVDDISSGSTSQLCIIGTIMNLVLLYQASTKYNIVNLDEVDGGLDTHNRYDFIPTLYKLIEILRINQLIMISHNIESDLSGVDLIRLQGYDDDPGDYQNANVIFDFNKL